jgi:hypothetical protein
MNRGQHPKPRCRPLTGDGPERLSGRNPSAGTPHHTSCLRPGSHPESSAEVSLGVRGHTPALQRAHAPPASPSPPMTSIRPLTPTPAQVTGADARVCRVVCLHTQSLRTLGDAWQREACAQRSSWGGKSSPPKRCSSRADAPRSAKKAASGDHDVCTPRRAQPLNRVYPATPGLRGRRARARGVKGSGSATRSWSFGAMRIALNRIGAGSAEHYT